jgi:chromosome segregation ATPase
MDIKHQLAESLEYQDRLHEKIATLEAEVDCRILLSEHNRQVTELNASIEELEGRVKAAREALRGNTWGHYSVERAIKILEGGEK